MTRETEEAIRHIRSIIPYVGQNIKKSLDMAIQALEQEPYREIEDYENEIEDLHNRLDIAEYDKERLREEVTNLEEKIKSLEQEPKWIPVSERLPEEGRAVLVHESEYNNIYCAYLYDDTWFIYGSCRSYSVANVIAWMPLPEPYKESEG